MTRTREEVEKTYWEKRRELDAGDRTMDQRIKLLDELVALSTELATLSNITPARPNRPK